MTSAAGQLRALLALRWQMARAPGLRLVICLVGLLVIWLLYVVVSTADRIDAPTLATAVQVAPSAYLGFGFLALIAPLTAGGGNEIVPPDQLVAYPVRGRTQFLGGLVLAPLNLVWVLQLLVLAAVTAYLTLDGGLLLGGLTTTAFVVAVTVFGQALAWTIVGVRQTRRGRQVVTTAGCLLLLGAVALVRLGLSGAVLDHSPTRYVSRAVIAADGNFSLWGTVTGLLVVLCAVLLVVGGRACSWALRRPGDSGASKSTEPVRRRPAQRSVLRELVAVDRASVWRAPALRRGGLVLAVLPGVLAAGAAVPWQSLVVLPGLVAAGAGLLFGVNAFCLDGSGAVWLASLPHAPRRVVQAKTIVLAETVLLAVVIAAVSGSLRSPGTPTLTEVTAIVASGLLCTAIVVAVGLAGSVRRPHRADLRGPRDAVAPPGTMALASVRMALPCAFAGIVLGSATRTDVWWLSPLLAVPFLLCLLSLRRTFERYDQPIARARIVSVVSAG